MPPLQETIELPIRGMTCGHCSSTVQRALEQVPGVRSAAVALDPGSARIEFDSSSADVARLKSAIESAGYQVPIEIETDRAATSSTTTPVPSLMAGKTDDWNFSVGGMHCASCVARVEDALRKVPGVRSARVNLAIERANVTLNPSKVTEDDLVRAVRSAGYTLARSELFVGTGAESLRRERSEGVAYWRARLISGALLTAPLVILGYIPLETRVPPGWMMFPLATILLFELGSPYFRGAWERARQGTSNMDTLIAIGTLTAYGYSLVHILRESPLRATDLPVVLAFAAYGAVAVALTRFASRRVREVDRSASES